MTADPSVGMTADAAAFARLAAEGDALRRQEAAALAADTTSEMYREYVARLQAHLVALSTYLGAFYGGLVPKSDGGVPG